MPASNTAPQTKLAFMKKPRNFLDLALMLIGTQVILSVALFTQALSNMAILLLGVLLFEVGIFKLAPKLLPDNRKYHALRAQTNQFLKLVRQLNAAALAVQEHDTPENRQAVKDIQQAMQQLVERMPTVAGRTDSALIEAATDPAAYDATVDVANPTTTAHSVER